MQLLQRTVGDSEWSGRSKYYFSNSHNNVAEVIHIFYISPYNKAISKLWAVFNITASWWCKNRSKYKKNTSLRNSKSAVLKEYVKSVVVLSKWVKKSLLPQHKHSLLFPHPSCARSGISRCMDCMNCAHTISFTV